MTADIVNLRRARKVAARRKGEDTAAQNRVAFGISKIERDRVEAVRDLDARRLDGHRRAPIDGT